MIHTGGAADNTLLAVGSTLDHLTKQHGRDFVMVFDRTATYLMKDAKFVRQGNRIKLQHNNNGATIMQTATRGPNESDVYEAPLYDEHDSNKPLSHSTQESCKEFLSEIKKLSTHPGHVTEPA